MTHKVDAKLGVAGVIVQVAVGDRTKHRGWLSVSQNSQSVKAIAVTYLLRRLFGVTYFL